MGSAWGGAGPPLSLVDIAVAVETAGAPLPPELVGFYLSHNGGWPEADGSPDASVHGYLRLGPGDTECGGLAASMGAEHPQLSGLFPFAYDAGGNTFWVSLRAADVGATFLHLGQTDDLEPIGIPLAELLPPEALGWGFRPVREALAAGAHPQLADLYRLGDGLLTDEGIQIYAVDDLAERNKTYEIADCAPGFQLVGDDSGGRGFLLRLSVTDSPVSPVYASGLGDLAPESFLIVGDDLPSWVVSLR